MAVKMRAPDFDQRGLPDYNKDYVKHTYYEEVRVVDGIAYVSNRDSIRLLESEGFVIIPEVITPKKQRKPRKLKLTKEEERKRKKNERKRKTRRKQRKKRKGPRVIFQD